MKRDEKRLGSLLLVSEVLDIQLLFISPVHPFSPSTLAPSPQKLHGCPVIELQPFLFNLMPFPPISRLEDHINDLI